MKKPQNIFAILYVIISAFLATGCLPDKQKGDKLAVIDVSKSYPEKETLLTDIADVTYLYLNSDNDDYLYSGRIHSITENTVVVYDNISGSILFFSKDGNPKSRFNRKGNGPEEYLSALQVIYDEAADDVFVARMNIIQVYSSTGEYKRRITMPEGTVITPIVPFDEHSLFLYDGSKSIIPDSNETNATTDGYVSPFVRISKIDGSVLDYVELPTDPIVLGVQNMDDRQTVIRGRTSRLVQCKEGVLLCNPETDTVFLYSKDYSLTPVMTKTPSVKTLPMTYLNNCVDVGQYQFMEVFTVRLEEGAFPFPVNYLMRDKKTGEIFRQKILLPDYKGKEFLFSPLKSGRDYEYGPIFELDLGELKQAYDENKLSGKLKELVATLDEDVDNNIFMLVHFK